MAQQYQLAEVAQQNGRNGKPLWLIIQGCVYDVTSFLAEHPGGDELLREQAGKDATKAFNSAGHSPDAIKELKQYKIGELALTPVVQTQPKTMDSQPAAAKQTVQQEEPKEEKSSSFCCC